MSLISRVMVAIIGVAALAVIVSRSSTTPAVLQSLGAALSNILGAVVSPVASGAAATASNAAAAATAPTTANSMPSSTIGGASSLNASPIPAIPNYAGIVPGL